MIGTEADHFTGYLRRLPDNTVGGVGVRGKCKALFI